MLSLRLAAMQDVCTRDVPDPYTVSDIMRVLAEAGQFQVALTEMQKLYTLTKREDVHQFGASQLASIAGHMVSHPM